MLRSLLIIGVLGLLQQIAAAQATQPADDAAKVYAQAAKLFNANDKANIMSPSSSNLGYPDFPPYPAAWHSMERKDFSANVEARALAHQARSIEHANWPKWNPPHPPMYYLNDCRNISNELSDAALYEHFQGDDAAAIESLLDDWHLADLLENEPDKLLIRLLVSEGIQAEIVNRLEIITSKVALTKDPGNEKALQTSMARELIHDLLTHPDAQSQLNDVVRDESRQFHTRAETNPILKPSLDRILETSNRINAERGLAAMSLACHLYRFDTGKWPTSLDDLSGYFPSLPIDPFGDGKQTLGYALIRHGLPDGADRPLVYSRCQSRNGLFFRTDQPAYGFYTGDGSRPPARYQKQGGQFRDVASWAPEEGTQPAPTTRPLE